MYAQAATLESVRFGACGRRTEEVGDGKPVPVPDAAGGSPREEARRTSLGFALLLVAMLLTALANATGNLGRSFLMAEGSFSKSAITLTAAIIGLAGLVFSFLMGRLADRIGRRWVLIASIAVTAASLLLLGFASREWQFYIFAALFGFPSVATAIAPAYVVGVEPRNVGRSVSLVQSSFWVGSIIGMAATGVVAARLGTAETVLVSCAFPAVAALLLLLRRRVKARSQRALSR